MDETNISGGQNIFHLWSALLCSVWTYLSRQEVEIKSGNCGSLQHCLLLIATLAAETSVWYLTMQ